MTSYIISMATFGAIYAVLALALNLMWGVAGMVNLGIVGFYAFDHFLARPGALSTLLTHYFAFDANSVSNSVASLLGVNAAVFGIVVTVVSIIVQL